jgi:hypothetical protein
MSTKTVQASAVAQQMQQTARANANFVMRIPLTWNMAPARRTGHHVRGRHARQPHAGLRDNVMPLSGRVGARRATRPQVKYAAPVVRSTGGLCPSGSFHGTTACPMAIRSLFLHARNPILVASFDAVVIADATTFEPRKRLASIVNRLTGLGKRDLPDFSRAMIGQQARAACLLLNIHNAGLGHNLVL